jgi:hypothetical protein
LWKLGVKPPTLSGARQYEAERTKAGRSSSRCLASTKFARTFGGTAIAAHRFIDGCFHWEESLHHVAEPANGIGIRGAVADAAAASGPVRAIAAAAFGAITW